MSKTLESLAELGDAIDLILTSDDPAITKALEQLMVQAKLVGPGARYQSPRYFGFKDLVNAYLKAHEGNKKIHDAYSQLCARLNII